MILNQKYLIVLCVLISIWIAESDSFTVSENTSSNETRVLDNGSDWWELTQTNETLFNSFKGRSNIYLRTVDLDERKIHSCYEYKVVSTADQRTTHMDTFCYPSIIITGHRKCSTSALYSLLSQYPGVLKSQYKENCAFLGERSIVQYFESLPRSVDSGDLIVDGCIDLKGNIRLREMLRQPNTFYIVLLRDYADWIWSAYNYWCQPEYDAGCSLSSHWVDVDHHLRSPGLFHEILQGSMNGTHVASPLLFKQPCAEGGSIFRQFVSRLWSSVPAENTLVLASEDLERDPSGVWARIAAAVGLDGSHPKLKEFAEVRYNTQLGAGSKGESAKVAADKVKPGLYAVSKFQPLLDASRSVLDACWRDDCLWSSLITGHQYAACSGVNDKSVGTAIPTSTNETVEVAQARYFAQRSPNTSFAGPFLRRKVDECRERFGTRRASSKKHTLKPEHKAAPVNERVLILSTSKEHRFFAQNLLFYAAGMHDLIDTDDATNITTSSTENCQAPLPSVVCTSPSNVRASQSHPGMLELIHHKTHCPSHSENNRFSRVIAIVSDSLVSMWTSYQLAMHQAVSSSTSSTKVSASALEGAISDAMIHFNWTRWEEVAGRTILRQVANSGESVGLIKSDEYMGPSNDAVWSAEQSALLDRMSSTNKMVVRIEDLKYSADRLRTLYEVIQFITHSTSISESNGSGGAKEDGQLGPKQPLYKVTKESLQCAQLLTNDRSARPFKHIASSAHANLELAYASEDLVCRVTQLFQNSSLQLSTIRSAIHNTSCLNGVSTQTSSHRKCKLRYDKRTYISSVKKHPVVLLAPEGSDSVNTRLLIEHATGIYSGAMETNRFLTDLLHGESFCGQRMSVIHANPADVTIKDLRSGVGTVSLTNRGIKKCRNGMVRGFAMALLVVRDPFLAVWREYHEALVLLDSHVRGVTRRASDVEKSALTEGYPPEMEEALLNVTRHYRRGRLEVSHAYDRLQNCNFDANSVLIVSFEALITSSLSTRDWTTTTLGQTNNTSLLHTGLSIAPSSVLKDVLNFAHFDEIYPERLECAFQFAEADGAVQQTQRMHAYLSARPQLVCAMERLFREMLSPNKFRFIRLYQDLQC